MKEPAELVRRIQELLTQVTSRRGLTPFGLIPTSSGQFIEERIELTK